MTEKDVQHIPEGWVTKPLIDCTEDGTISYGIVQPGSNEIDGVPIVRVNNFSNGTLDLSSVLRVAPSIEEKYARTRLQGGEVLLTLVGSTGQSAIVPRNMKGWNVPRAIAVIRPKSTVGANWINICLQSQATKDFLDARANTTVQKTLNLKDVRQIPILIPPKKIKNFIESTICSIDDKIELNRRMNATLEAMAQALFKSWFVDFDPVIDNALAAGHPIPEPLQERAEARAALGDQRQPLPEAIRQQFPNRFVCNEDMGWVPEGWRVRSVQDSIEINPRVTLKAGETASYVDMKALPTTGYAINEVIKKPYSGGVKFQQGDVLLARITPCLENGKTGVVDFLNKSEPGFGSTEFIVLRGKSGIRTAFIACLARYPHFRAHCELGMVGSSGRQRVQNSCFGDFFLALPSDERLLVEFDTLTSKYFQRMSINRTESISLVNLRDTLLPKLLSGQLRIPEAEQQVADML